MANSITQTYVVETTYNIILSSVNINLSGLTIVEWNIYSCSLVLTEKLWNICLTKDSPDVLSSLFQIPFWEWNTTVTFKLVETGAKQVWSAYTSSLILYVWARIRELNRILEEPGKHTVPYQKTSYFLAVVYRNRGGCTQIILVMGGSMVIVTHVFYLISKVRNK